MEKKPISTSKQVISINKRKETLSLETIDVETTSRWTTGIAAVDKSPFVLVSSGCASNNLQVIENTNSNKLERNEDGKGNLVVRALFSMPRASYDINCLGNYLISSGPNGTAQVYQVDRASLGMGDGVKRLSEYTISSILLEDIDISPPNQMIRNVRTNCARFEPWSSDSAQSNAGPKRFSAIQGSSVYLIDIESQTTVGTEKIGNSLLSKLNYSDHSPSGSLLATCNYDSNISILDSRLLQAGTKSVVWSHDNAHAGKVNDVAFNPFIPFWIASAGEDGVLKMWDMRYLKNCAARIDAHYSGITGISWSNTHCQIISTVSNDRSWRSWSLQSDVISSRNPWKGILIGCPGSEFETDYQSVDPAELCVGGVLIADYNTFLDPAIGVVASPSHLDSYYSVTSTGLVSCHTMQSSVLENLFKHRYDNLYAMELESAIQNRHLEDAYEALVKLSRTEFAKDDKITKFELELINHCKFRPAIDTSSWHIGSNDSCLFEDTRADLSNYTYGLPPRFEEFSQWSQVVPETIQKQFELVLLRHQIVSEINLGNWEIILQKEKDLIKGIEFDLEFLDFETINLIIETALRYSFIKGLTIGLKLATILADSPKFKFDNVGHLMHLFVFPTVYDNYSWVPNNETKLMDQKSDARQVYIKYHLDALKREKENVSNPMLMARHGTKRGAVVSNTPTESVTSGKALIKAVTTDVKSAMPMVSLELRILKVLETPPKEPLEEIIRIMQNVLTDSGVLGNRSRGAVVPFERTISVVSNRLYLKALLDSKRFDDYFGVALNLIASYMPFPFALSILKQIETTGNDLVSTEINSLIGSANTQLNTILANPTVTQNVSPQTIIQSIKQLKDAMVLIVRISGHFMDGLDALKAEKECIEIFQRIITSLTNYMLKASPLILKAFEFFDKLSKQLCREFAHTVHDGIRDATRTLPITSNKSRPVNLAEKTATGITMQDDAFNLLEKLYKSYLKPETS